MRILPSALAHGIRADQIRSALQVAMRQVELEDGLMLVIGADSSAELLEIIVADSDRDDPRVIHAMKLRAKFRHHLRGGLQ